MKFFDLVASDIRLLIVQALAADAGYSQNESVILSILGMFGHHIGTDRVRTELTWLEEQGLVKIETIASVMVATITKRGLDASSGAAAIPGIRRPGPRC